jgi:uncharacterized protein
MNPEATQKNVPVLEGLFTWPSDNPHLIVTKCSSCNSYYFPKKPTCSNPECVEKKVQDVELSNDGTLWSYTIMRYPPAIPFKSEKKAPFPLGLVEFPEGIRVLGLLTECKPEDLKIGMKMKMVLEPLYHDEKGQGVLTWTFKPAGK